MPRKVIMTSDDIRRTLARIAHEIIEQNKTSDNLILVGMHTRGVPLARRVGQVVCGYSETYGERPRAIWMQNHGLIALGTTAQEVVTVTAMAVKAARIILGTYQLGGPNFLTEPQVRRLHTRPDDLYRRSKLGLG